MAGLPDKQQARNIFVNNFCIALRAVYVVEVFFLYAGLRNYFYLFSRWQYSISLKSAMLNINKQQNI
jgi:hypothetical protein